MIRTTRSMATANGKGLKKVTAAIPSSSSSSKSIATTTPSKIRRSTRKRKTISQDKVSRPTAKKKEQIKQKEEEQHRLQQQKEGVKATESFQPISALTFDPKSKIQTHTLLLGTYPSIESLAQSQYYGHPMNTFWWIAGDNLGFRRSDGISKSTNKPYQLTKDLLYGTDKIIPYDEQVQTLTNHGFALWDILHSCHRKGSLDNKIKNEIPNDIRAFCESNLNNNDNNNDDSDDRCSNYDDNDKSGGNINSRPSSIPSSIRRIVLSNGSSGAIFFNRHFKDWWLSGKLKPGSNKESIRAFGKFEKMMDRNNKKMKYGGIERDSDSDKDTDKDGRSDSTNMEDNRIEVICGLGVSPAAAKFSYVEKRDFYKEYCYDPGLEDHKRLNEQ